MAATYSATARTSSAVNVLVLRRDCCCCPALGIRPLDIWNDTAAAPTFWMLGPIAVPLTVTPSPLSPWHDAQFFVKSCCPVLTSVGSGDACETVGEAIAERPPMTARAAPMRAARRRGDLLVRRRAVRSLT